MLQCFRFMTWVGMIAVWVVSATAAAESIDVRSVLLRLTEQVEIPAQEAGMLAAVMVREGARVQVGDVLAQVDDREVQIRRQRAEVELEIARKEAANELAVREAQEELLVAQEDYTRGKESRDKFTRAITDSELAHLRLAATRAELKLLRTQHEHEVAGLTESLKAKDVEAATLTSQRRRITSPLDGVVVEVFKKPGEWVEPGEPIARVIRVDRLRAEGFIDADQAARDLVGAKVSLTLESALPTDKTFSGELVFVSPEVDPVNRQTRVWAEITNPGPVLRPGLRARMRIEVPTTGR